MFRSGYDRPIHWNPPRTGVQPVHLSPVVGGRAVTLCQDTPCDRGVAGSSTNIVDKYRRRVGGGPVLGWYRGPDHSTSLRR